MKKIKTVFPYCVKTHTFQKHWWNVISEEEISEYRAWLTENIGPENFHIAKNGTTIEFLDEEDLTMFSLRFGYHEKTLTKLEKMLLHENSLERMKEYK